MFALVENNTVVRYPYSVYDLSRENPNTSFGKNLSDDELLAFGMHRVFFSTRPDVSWSQTTEETNPVFNSESQRWEQSWIVRDLTADELQSKVDEHSASIRSQRNAKLAETDWRFRSDMNPSQAWKDYCQALRDITSQSGFPSTVDWPTQPE